MVEVWVRSCLINTKIKVQVCASIPPLGCPVLCVTPPEERLTVLHIVARLKKQQHSIRSDPTPRPLEVSGL